MKPAAAAVVTAGTGQLTTLEQAWDPHFKDFATVGRDIHHLLDSFQ